MDSYDTEFTLKKCMRSTKWKKEAGELCSCSVKAGVGYDFINHVFIVPSYLTFDYKIDYKFTRKSQLIFKGVNLFSVEHKSTATY